MSYLAKQIASKGTIRKILVASAAIFSYLGFTSLSFLTSIYQLAVFLQIALILYLFLIFSISFVFDLKLKLPKSWQRSSYYYHHVKHRVSRLLKIVGRALALRFRYLNSEKHWRHFLNYLILPSALYWAIVVLIFLNPFETLFKQIFIITGVLLFTILIWHLKAIFISYSSASINARYLMFASMVITGFLAFSAALGLTWYLGMSITAFAVSVFAVSALLMYQSLYHHPFLDIVKDIRFVLLGSLILAAGAYLVGTFWTVNYFSGGLLLAGGLHLYWSMVLQGLQGRLTASRVFDYALIFLFIVLFVLVTTNFNARIA